MMTVALWAAQHGDQSLLISWRPSPHCPSNFLDHWTFLASQKPWESVPTIRILNPDNESDKTVLSSQGFDTAEFEGFGSCDTIARMLREQIGKMLASRGLAIRTDVPDVRHFWTCWQPHDDIKAKVISYMTNKRITSPPFKGYVGVHFRRGDLQVLLANQAARRGEEVDYEQINCTFRDVVHKKLVQGLQIIVATDSYEGLELWVKRFRNNINAGRMVFGPHNDKRVSNMLKGHYLKPNQKQIRQTDHEQFTFELYMLAQCEHFIGTEESSVKDLVRGLRTKPARSCCTIGPTARTFTGGDAKVIMQLAVHGSEASQDQKEILASELFRI